MACILDGSKLTLSGAVGDDWWGDAFSYSDVLLALAEVDEDADLTVHINSGGGIATEGAAIHSLLANRPGKTDIVIEGIAASAASLIAMARCATASAVRGTRPTTLSTRPARPSSSRSCALVRLATLRRPSRSV